MNYRKISHPPVQTVMIAAMVARMRDAARHPINTAAQRQMEVDAAYEQAQSMLRSYYVWAKNEAADAAYQK